MRVRDSFHVMRRWRSVIVAGILIGVAVGWVSAPGASATTTTFQATQTLLLDPLAPSGSQDGRTAAVLTNLGPVPGRVAARLGIDRRQVQSMVSAGPIDKVGVLSISARSANRALAEALAKTTAEELIVELGGPQAPFRTLEPAVASPVKTGDIEGPSSRQSRALLLGAFGLLLGVGAAFGVERFDKRIRSKRTAEAALGVAIMAEVPRVAQPDRGRLLTGAQPSSFIEAYRGLRTSVEHWTARTENHDGHRVIVVTSATAGEGKTTTVAHLAVTLAEVGRSVLVISADLRRPRLHLYFDRALEPGLVEVLRGAPDVRRVTDLNLITTIPGVRFVASGAAVENPGPLLEGAGDLLRDARSLAEFVLVDSPPLLTTSDAAQLAHYADGVLFVVRAGRTSIRAAVRSAERLQLLGIPVLGAVLVASDAVRTSSRSARPRQGKIMGRRAGKSASRVVDGAPSR
jgi:succinoglycan biosynthesis transport protein ExoP